MSFFNPFNWGSGGGSSPPSYPSFGTLAGTALKYAPKFTQQNIDLQNQVTPGSSAQRQLAQNQINQYIQGEVPLDVQQNTQRAIAQALGGGYNAFTGGGQAPNAFARNIGQTSVGLSQFGLSAAPTWQQLANSMVTRPDALMPQVQQTSENQYQAQYAQYEAPIREQQRNQQLALQLGSLALGAYTGLGNASYLSSLAPSVAGKIATFGGLPATQGLDDLASSYGSLGGSVGRPGTASFNAAMSAGGWD